MNIDHYLITQGFGCDKTGQVYQWYVFDGGRGRLRVPLLIPEKLKELTDIVKKNMARIGA